MKKIFYTLILTLILGSCVDDKSVGDSDTVPLLVSGVSTQSASTRSASLGSGSAIGVSRMATSSYSAQTNYKYVNTSGVWSASSDRILLSGKDAVLCAYSPYSSSINLGSIPLRAGVYNSSNDFCYGYKLGVTSANMGSGVSFEMSHAYAELTLHFAKGSSFCGTGDVKNIIVSGASSAATLNLSQSSASYVDITRGDITVSDGNATIFNAVNSSSYDVVLLVPPCTLSSGLTFTINVDGLNKTTSLPSSSLDSLKANTNYTIPIEIGQKLDIGTGDTNSVSITNWVVPPSVTSPWFDAPVQPESNSYIVAPGSTIYIPVSRASTGNPANFSTSDAFTAGLLWSDVSATHVTPTVIGRFIKVVAGTTEGNSVIYAMKGGKIVWSWHIWVTGYNPSTTNETYNTRVWMDRNLGAKTKDKGASAYGLYYQWGRKDPFPAGVFTGSIMSTGNFLNTSGSVSVDTAISTPMTYYYAGSANDWNSVFNDNLWNSSNDSKTVYDPCPDGWRVPPSTDYFYSTFLYNAPSGYRSGSNGSFDNVGIFGVWWCGAANSMFAYYLASDGSTDSYVRAGGFPVRCVRN